VRTTGVTWGGRVRRTNAPPIFFLPESVFFDYRAEKGNKKMGLEWGKECTYVKDWFKPISPLVN